MSDEGWVIDGMQKNDVDKLLMKLIGAKVKKQTEKFVSCMVIYFGDLESTRMHEQ